MRSQHPTPALAPFLEEHFARAEKGEFTIQKCDDDGAVWYPPSQFCPKCLGTSYTWSPVSGKAKLWSWVSIHQPYIKAFTDEIPYLVAYVQLEEGPMLMSTIIDADPSELAINADLTLSLELFGENETARWMPVFQVAN